MKILFPIVRYTDIATQLAPFVKNMARAFHAELHILTVEPAMDQYLELRIKEAIEWLDEFIEKNFSDYPVQKGEVLPGSPARKILDYIDDHLIDCVVIGIHSSRKERVSFGSVGKEILFNAAIPVLSINPDRLTDDFKRRNGKYLAKIFKNGNFTRQV